MLKGKSPVAQILLATLLLTTLAGCLEQSDVDTPADTAHNGPNSSSGRHPGDSDPGEQSPDPEPNEKTGSITGEITNSDFDALAGASAHLYNASQTLTNSTTDDEGKYTVNNIPPGRYNLEFNHPCCREDIQSIEVTAGEVLEKSAILEVWDTSADPYVVEDEWAGFISCSTSALNILLELACDNFDEDSQRRHTTEVDEAIETLVVAMEWEGGFNLQDCLYLRISAIGGGVVESGECESSPIELRLEAEGTEEWLNLTEAGGVNFFVSERDYCGLGCITHNVVYQQRFTIYWEEYYWEKAPETATALPES